MYSTFVCSLVTSSALTFESPRDRYMNCLTASSLFVCSNLEYAQVIKMLGNGRLEAMCFDGVKRLCHIRGKLRKKVILYTVAYIALVLPVTKFGK